MSVLFTTGRRGGRGVIVTAVESGSPAKYIDMQPGDLWVSTGRCWLTDVHHIGTLLTGVDAADPVEMGSGRERRGKLYDGEVRLYAP